LLKHLNIVLNTISQQRVEHEHVSMFANVIDTKCYYLANVHVTINLCYCRKKSELLNMLMCMLYIHIIGKYMVVIRFPIFFTVSGHKGKASRH